LELINQFRCVFVTPPTRLDAYVLHAVYANEFDAPVRTFPGRFLYRTPKRIFERPPLPSVGGFYVSRRRNVTDGRLTNPSGRRRTAHAVKPSHLYLLASIADSRGTVPTGHLRCAGTDFRPPPPALRHRRLFGFVDNHHHARPPRPSNRIIDVFRDHGVYIYRGSGR